MTKPLKIDFPNLVRAQSLRKGLMAGLIVSATYTFAAVSTPSIRAATIDPANWPLLTPPLARDERLEQQVQQWLERLTLSEKVGQLIQADLGSVTPAQARRYHLGSILNSGETGPGENPRAPAEQWLMLADAFWSASTDRSDGRAGIPLLWGTDAVHGHNNVLGATIFPHNIGLGAANDAELVKAIGQATALEMRVTGQDWTFAPTVAVVRNDRWGRTYESYSEQPAIVARLAAALVTGLQGKPGSNEFLKSPHVIATAKHFIGDGGTANGVDQGDNQMTESQLRDLQLAGFTATLDAGVQSVMASFNSWHGVRLHGHKPLLTDVLRDRLKFDGITIGDWNGHAMVPTCRPGDCLPAINAGLDVFMVPEAWQQLHQALQRDARSGALPPQRLNEAVARVLRVKLRAGLFDAGAPSSRTVAGQWAQLGSAEHRALARRAVRQSLVLLKNGRVKGTSVLPIPPGATVLITGPLADDLPAQMGGWSMNWQGADTSDRDFPGATAIGAGLKQAIETAGGKVISTGDAAGDPPAADLAIVIYGERPYAEFKGDRPDVDFQPGEPLSELKRLREAGIPTVSVFISGRPLWVDPELAASDAFVAVWLPGTAGEGVADVLVADASGKQTYDFTGRLSFSWPADPADAAVNADQADPVPRFPLGYGLSYQVKP